MTDTRVWKLPESAPDPAELAAAWSKVVENGIAAMRAGAGAAPSLAFDPTAPARAMADFTVQLWSNPMAVLQASQAAASEWAELWGTAARRAAGQQVEPVIAPERGDRRFGDAAWSEDPVFDYLKQAYLLASRQATDLVAKTEGIDEATRTRAEFFTNAYLGALSPANFAFTNPEAIRRAIDTGSISLLSGLANLLADAATDAKLPKRRASAQFELGEDIAATPGSVVFQNELMQLIQYAPMTEEVVRRPLLYVPPLVNKYYLLDLQPKSSLIRWLVEQGHTLFVISWVNPGPELADKGLDDYLALGPAAAMDAIVKATGERDIDLFGFCMGGTLAAMAAARAAPGRIASLTTIGSMFDFANMGQWSTFREPAQIEAMERHLEAKGVLAAHELQALFSVVRANDLIWSSVVSHYLLDKEVPPSDILHWFADGAHIPRAFLLDWTNKILRDNELTRPGALDFDAPAFVISLKDDHVSAWQATYDGARLLGPETRFLLGGSGHNAGVINPPSANKHGYWTNEKMPETAEAWLETATRHEGSWWPQWQQWLVRDGAERVKARKPKKPIEPAPGSYVRMR
ncbi:MAG: poly[(R)-3-hydroxyalkanoate] polymerase subunit PhaC [Sphingomonadales bacterium]|jgi:polyhydroxyalkanoate synthase|nr:poly[(R)-3-hydroxyalkanoate] polymerase subunit PhaC [Sphingomonadales bacterium]